MKNALEACKIRLQWHLRRFKKIIGIYDKILDSKHIALDFIFLYAIYIFKIKLTLYNKYQFIKYVEKLYDDTSCSSRRFIYACANM